MVLLIIVLDINLIEIIIISGYLKRLKYIEKDKEIHRGIEIYESI